MDAPGISTAIPQHRYRIGDYQATLLGEIQSSDDIEYRFILAFVPEGHSQPVLYVCSERNRGPDVAEGTHRIRVINDSMSEVLDLSNRWGNQDAFTRQALDIGRKMLGLGEEAPIQLL